MDDPKVLERMRADWNQRAAEDANYYVAFGRREQPDDEFFATGADVVRGLVQELKRLRARDAALEIGCGPGRLMRPMSAHFAEIHGVDVSDEMIRMARERLRGTPNAHPHHGDGTGLGQFPDNKFDLVYSYAVFQHIPSRDVVFRYLEEARRVLKPGGVLRCQLNGLPPHARQYDTWSGVRITPEEIAAFALAHDLQLLAVEQVWTQYMWITARKRPAGWARSLATAAAPPLARIQTICNAWTGEAAVPAAGKLAAISIWIERFPAEADLNHLAITADGLSCRPIYIGEPDARGITQVNAALPAGLRSGLVPIDVRWLDRPVCPTGWVRVLPPCPAIPRIVNLTDGVNLLSGSRIVSRTVKVAFEELEHPEAFRATVDGVDVLDTDAFCTDASGQCYEINFRLPAAIAPGPHAVSLSIGRRAFHPMPIEVA